MHDIKAKKKIIKRELAELKLALSNKKKKLKKKKVEHQKLYEEQKRNMEQKLSELKNTLDAKNVKFEKKVAKIKSKIDKEKKELFKVISIEQHNAINHLETYLEEVDHKYENLGGFWKTTKKEFRDLMRKRKKARNHR